MAADNFWTTSAARDPKRAFRFTVEFTDLGILWYAKTVTKPKITFGEAEHNFLNHRFYYPGRAEWDPVTLTLVDPVSPDAASVLLGKISETGYRLPASAAGLTSVATGGVLSTPSKNSSVEAFGDLLIRQIDQDGAAVETWTLNNAWIKDLSFGDLDYSSDELLELTMTVRYDWASFEGTNGVELFRPE